MSFQNDDIEVVFPLVKDAEALIDYCNEIGGESDYLTFGRGQFHYTVEEERDFIGRKSDGKEGRLIMARLRGSGVIVGVASAFSKGRRSKHVFELGVSVRQKFWRRGIGTLLMKSCIEEAWRMGGTKVSLKVVEENQSAIKMYKKMGFKQEGVLVKEFNINGRLCNEICMFMLRDND